MSNPMHYAILDTRGLLMHAYHRSQRKTIETPDGFIPSWEDGLAEFINEHLSPILETYAPRQVLACFDGGNNARRRMYLGYKESRRARDTGEDPLKREQLSRLMEEGRRFLAYLGARTVHVPGEEADDLIGLLVERIEADSFIVHTRDKDLLQLVNEKVTVVCGGVAYGLQSYLEQSLNGVPFNLIVLMKAIVGDSSDGYPGVKGLGPKFFETLLAKYGAVGLAQLDAIVKAGRQELILGECELLSKLTADWPTLVLMHRVARIDPAHCYGALDRRKAPEWTVRVPSKTVVEGMLHRLGVFKPAWDRFFPTETLIDQSNASQLSAIAQEILASPIVSYDYESTDRLQHGPFRTIGADFVDVLSQELVSLSINYGDNLEKTIYVPFDHAETANLSREWAVWLLQVLQAVQPRAVVQNAAFELTLTATNLGLDLKAPFDTAIMSMYVDENEENHLKGMSKRLLNYDQVSYKEVTKGRRMHELTAGEALSYGCDDSLVTGHLFDLFRHIMQLEGSWAFYSTYEVDWAVDNAHYFIDGTDVDFVTLERFHTEAKARKAAGLETMHAGLAEHANKNHTQESAQRCASVLLDEAWVMARRRYEGNPEKAQGAYKALWEKCWNGCYYRPPTQRIPVKFSPTPAQCSAVAALIDVAIPRLEKATIKGIEAWEGAAMDALDVAKKSRPIDPMAEPFVAAVFGARKTLKNRAAPATKALEELALGVLQERGDLKAIQEGDHLNTNSSQQMQELLYGKLQLPLRRRSKVTYGSTRHKLGVPGGPATGLKAIQSAFVYDIGEDDWRAPVLEGYLNVAKATQEISLYHEPYPVLVHPRDGRIHPQIKNCGTTTRRPSGTAPNVLQVAKGPLRTVFRGGDYGDGERVYVCCDFAGQELVITACESRDPTMLAAFMSTPRKDVHSLTSTGFAHILLERMGIHTDGPLDYDTFMAWRHHEDPVVRKATDIVRNKYGKAANFLIAYLGQASTLAENLLIPLEDAKTMMNSVFALYPRLSEWQQETTEFAIQNGYTLTAYGNRRHAPNDLWSNERGLASRAARQVVNATVQGTAADILKVVLTEMVCREMRQRYRLKALKPVYDEISASVPIELAVDYAQELIEVMSITPPGYPVGMKVDLSIGKTWGSVVEIEDPSAESIRTTLENLT